MRERVRALVSLRRKGFEKEGDKKKGGRKGRLLIEQKARAKYFATLSRRRTCVVLSFCPVSWAVLEGLFYMAWRGSRVECDSFKREEAIERRKIISLLDDNRDRRPRPTTAASTSSLTFPKNKKNKNPAGLLQEDRGQGRRPLHGPVLRHVALH